MTTVSRFEAAQLIAVRISDAKRGLPSKFTARAWQGTDGSPPPVRVYVDSAAKRKPLGYVTIMSDGSLLFDRIQSQGGAIKRLVGKALHGVDVLPDELTLAESTPSVVVLWEGITSAMSTPVQVAVDDGNECVMVRGENGEWSPTDDDALVLDALWSAVTNLAQRNGR